METREPCDVRAAWVPSSDGLITPPLSKPALLDELGDE